MPATGRVAFILKGYPRLSETFIAQEIAALEARGLAIDIVSLRHPTDRLRHPVHDAIKAPLRYLPEYLKDEPARVWRAFLHCRGLPGFRMAFAAWRRDWASPAELPGWGPRARARSYNTTEVAICSFWPAKLTTTGTVTACQMFW